ncbi:hypothetical protein ElyMa_002388700 [Elysia marginata]|uniref:Uncharacterized protein n=1 Tax=Elysia marginata TaxID=1093978 RepID=A0AAV4GCH8_9GAST|nr:hypothetical protein ElyMa_002388700 [Elysia marginata]
MWLLRQYPTTGRQCADTASGYPPLPIKERETTFQRTISSRNWPNPEFAALLSSAACKQDTPACSALPEKSNYELREEFVRLVIYYEDLNYEELTELADYENSVSYFSNKEEFVRLVIYYEDLNYEELTELADYEPPTKTALNARLRESRSGVEVSDRITNITGRLKEA